MVSNQLRKNDFSDTNCSLFKWDASIENTESFRLANPDFQISIHFRERKSHDTWKIIIVEGITSLDHITDPHDMKLRWSHQFFKTTLHQNERRDSILNLFGDTWGKSK